MKFNIAWLKEWVGITQDAGELAGILTASGLEVDTYHPVAADFRGVVIARITECQPHPNANKLSVCTVTTSTNDDKVKELQIVCGAPNARPGLTAPLAMVGARLGEDFEVGQATLRGVESFGMLCSARELGLSDDHSGLMELPDDAPLGKDLREYLSLDDVTLELELTPNRPDCLSIRGLAQDVAVSCNAELTSLRIDAVPPVIEDRIPVTLEHIPGCPRWTGRIIRGINAGAATPLWMSERLRRCGLRSISPVVDVTNYVMLELGQPMHAFDLDKLDTEIIVRQGRSGELLRLLDDQEIEFDGDALAICDAAGPVAMAGIMGGLDSSVTTQTSDILFEAAYFSPPTIMGKARDYGMHTDSSHRFERGVDPTGQVNALERATALLLEIAGGEPGPVLLAEESSALPVNTPVTLRIDRLNRVLGSDIDQPTATGILDRLGMQITDESEGRVTVVAPPARFDIAIEEDLIEEVARIYGYNNLDETLPSGEVKASAQPEGVVSLDVLRQALVVNGYQEIINYSFVDRSLLAAVYQDEQVLELANPLSAEMGVMRTSLLPGLLTTLSRNTRRQHSRVRLFETGRAYLQGDTLTERDTVAAVICGDALPESWTRTQRMVDFFDIKGDVEQLMALRGSPASEGTFEPCSLPWIHPGAGAAIMIGDKAAGWCGAVHPSVLKALKIRDAVFFFEIDLDILLQREIPFAKQVSRFPSVRRDLALMLPEDITFDQLKECVTGTAGRLLENLVLFDVYQGVNLTKGYKSLAIGLILQDVSSTLSDEDVDQLVQRVVQNLEQRLGAHLRG